jgi:hypothetical protein
MGGVNLIDEQEATNFPPVVCLVSIFGATYYKTV